MNKIFDNIGGKIKIIAKVVFWVDVVGTVGAIITALSKEVSFETKFADILSSVIFGLLLYCGAMVALGFGEIIESMQTNGYKLTKIETAINNAAKDTKKQLSDIDEKIAKINELAESEDEKSERNG